MKALKQQLTNKLTEQELQQLRTSFDIIGTIAIIEIPDELKKKEKTIAKAVLEINPGIKTVLKREGKHTGKYRLQKMKYLAGKKTKITEHKENGVRIQLHVEDCYFTPRLVTERARITTLIKPKEHILVLGSGVAPYPLVIAKNSKAQHITGIEINKKAHEWGIRNTHLNKLDEKITLHNNDITKKLPTLGMFDRIILPLPAQSFEHLASALHHIKKRGTLHLYQFSPENEFSQAEKKILQLCKQEKKTCKILRTVKAGQHKPRTYRICTDLKVS